MIGKSLFSLLAISICSLTYALDDQYWNTIVCMVVQNSDTKGDKSEIDKDFALQAYRNISSESAGLANLAGGLLQRTFNLAELPKRFDELSQQEVAHETQNLLVKPKSQGGFRDFLEGQKITITEGQKESERDVSVKVDLPK